MVVHFANVSYDFRPWRPEMGQVFSRGFAFDCETTLIDRDHPWLVPAYVIGAAVDGTTGYFVTRDRLASFLQLHRGVHVVMHHAAFDLRVIHTLAPRLDIYSWVDRNRLWDAELLHRLYTLGTAGHTASNSGEATLERCVELYLGVAFPKDVTDSAGQSVRLSYGRWLNCSPQDIEPVYLEYLAKDAIATRRIHTILIRRLRELRDGSHDVWGFVSRQWLDEQTRRWGPQTHHIQLRASIVLNAITANGLSLDMRQREQLVSTLEHVLAEQKEALRRHGYLPGIGSQKALQGIFRQLEREHPALSFLRTETGQYATSRDALHELADTVPFVRLLAEYRETEKLLNSFMGKMAKPVLHPSFNVLARSGRTTSFGDINAQNLPTDDRVRSCFVPSRGHVFIDADYSTVELVTLAQACLRQFGLRSAMAEAINAGQDLHRLVAARVTCKPPDEIDKEERSRAKPINFGKPGGMANTTLRQYAKVSYGVTLTEGEVEALSAAWLDLFPEMNSFLAQESSLGLAVAARLDLTPESHHAHTGDQRFVRCCRGDEANSPSAVLGGMLLKAARVERPATSSGRPYPTPDLDYFWTRLNDTRDLLPRKYQADVQARRPSARLARAIMALAGDAGVFTLTGRLRAKASYCARHNTVFQGLAADGAKLALWGLWRAGYRIVNFIHDEVLVEVPVDSTLKDHAERIRQLMVAGMRAVVPDMQVKIGYAACERWFKNANAAFDPTGKLLPWQPDEATTA